MAQLHKCHAITAGTLQFPVTGISPGHAAAILLKGGRDVSRKKVLKPLGHSLLHPACIKRGTKTVCLSLAWDMYFVGGYDEYTWNPECPGSTCRSLCWSHS